MGMAGLYVGLSGLQTSSNSLNTTANNLANVNTSGYVRQQVVNGDKSYNFVGTTAATTTGQKGLGVSIAKINHVRDMFLDAAYRKEYGRQGFYDKLYDSVLEIETQMGETDYITGIGFQKNISDFLQSINEVAKTPGDNTARSALVQSAVQFIDSAQTIYKGLVNYQSNLNAEIKTTVSRINEIGSQLVTLNRNISKIETGGYETASNLRDQRDMLLDELSSYCKITYNEGDNGSVEVYIEGNKFADEMSYNSLQCKAFQGTDLVDIVWPAFNEESLYSYSEVIATSRNTDIGGLKGLFIARGASTPTYEHADMKEPVPDDYITAQYPDGTGNPEYLRRKNEYDLYTQSVDTSALVNTIANFDKLISSMVQEINNVFCPEKVITIGGKEYTVLDTDKAPTTTDGEYGIELFTRDFCNRYTVTNINGTDYYVRNNINTFGNNSAYTIMNISVNKDIVQDYSKIPLSGNGGDAYNTAKELVDVFSKKIMRYNDSFDGMTFEEFYESMINDVANTGKIYNSMSTNETTLASLLDNQRQQVMGVASDEELSNMIKFQQAYNASSRFINVIDDMIQTLINNLGVR